MNKKIANLKIIIAIFILATTLIKTIDISNMNEQMKKINNNKT